MNLEAIKSELEALVPGCRLEVVANPAPSAQHSLLVDAEHAVAVAESLRNDPSLRFDYCSNVTGIDWPPKELTEMLGAKSAAEVSEMLLTAPSKRRQELAKLFKAVLGKKRAKAVSLKAFSPTTDVIWDRAELGRLVKEFEGFVTDQWEEGKYLKIE